MDEDEYCERLYQSHVALVRELSHLYPSERANMSHLGDAVKAVDDLVRLVEHDFPALSATSPCSPSTIACTFRSLERAIALTSLVDGSMRVDGRSPFHAVVFDGYRILKGIFDERPIRWPAVSASAETLPTDVICGLIADNLLVLQDLEPLFDNPVSGVTAKAQAFWEHAFDDFARRHVALGVENVAAQDFHAFRVLIGLTESELQELVDAENVLVVRSWTGEQLFPLSQIVSGSVPPQIGELLSLLDPDAIPPWHLAFLLRSGFDDRQTVAQALVNDMPAVVSWLQTSRAIRGYRGDPARPPSIPTEALIRFELTVPAEIEPKSTLFRITAYENGPYFFSNRDHRFDLPADSGHGTCYFSLSETGAFAEVLNKRPVLDAEHIFRLSLWEADAATSISPVLDVSDPETQTRLKWNHRLTTTMHRDVTKSFAATVFDVGFMAIQFLLTETGHEAGVALFGRSGRAAPQHLGHPSLYAARSELASRPLFWPWLADRLDERAGHFIAFQLPSGTVSLRAP